MTSGDARTAQEHDIADEPPTGRKSGLYVLRRKADTRSTGPTGPGFRSQGGTATGQIIATIGVGISLIGYLEVRLTRLENRLEGRIDRLTDQYIRHLEHHNQ